MVKTLFDLGLFNEKIPTALVRAQIDFVLNEVTGAIEATEMTSEEDAELVLGCLASAEEVYHAGLHFIEGPFQRFYRRHIYGRPISGVHAEHEARRRSTEVYRSAHAQRGPVCGVARCYSRRHDC